MAIQSLFCFKLLLSLVIARFVEQEYESHFMHSREGVTQGYLLAMVAYGIGILPMIKKPRAGFPDINQSWCSDDDGALSPFTIVESYFNSLKRHGPGRGYYPKPSKRVLIVHPYNVKYRKLFVSYHGFKVCMGAHYVGGYIRYAECKRDWLKYCTETWW